MLMYTHFFVLFFPSIVTDGTSSTANGNDNGENSSQTAKETDAIPEPAAQVCAPTTTRVPLDPKERRHRIVQEVLSTERTYVHSLEFAIQVPSACL